MIFGENCKPEIQRIRYKKGQLFSSLDLRDDGNITEIFRWLHNRALHNAYGVNEGMKVFRIDEEGNAVNENTHFVALKISKGLAYDCFGRELILPHSKIITLPPFSKKNNLIMTLLLCCWDQATSPHKDEIKESCIPGDFSLISEKTELYWKPNSLVELIDGVPLARIIYDEQGTPSLLANNCRESKARPLARPLIASGSTIPGNTAWNTWITKSGVFGIETKVNTSSAGFTEIPCYFAWIQQQSLWNEFKEIALYIQLENIYDPKPTKFTFRLLFHPILFRGGNQHILPQNLSAKLKSKVQNFSKNADNIIYDHFNQKQLHVSWLGIQPVREIK
jgi:hypothetical protein